VQQGTAAELASPGLAVHVPDGTTAQFSASVETHFNSSPCSAPISYTNSAKAKDEVPPAAPVLSSTDPVSPASAGKPKVLGSAEAGATVVVYRGSDCEGSPAADGTAAELAFPGLPVSAPSDSTSQFSATATDVALNTSACSNPISYTRTPALDEEAPAAPVLSATAPVSPSPFGAPAILGSAEAGATVQIFGGPSCTGPPTAFGSAGVLASPGIAVAVSVETTQQFSATASDQARNESPCSNPISYTNSTPFKTFVVPPPQAELPAPPPPTTAGCTVPKLAGKTLAQAKSALAGAGCKLGKISKPKPKRGLGLPAFVVRSSSPSAGSPAAGGVVAVALGPKPKRHRH
jgi:hypothetical protein